MVDLNPVNKLMMTSTITQLAPLSQPSTNLERKQISMSNLDTSHRKFTITQGHVSVSLNTDTVNAINKSQQSIKIG